MLHQQLTPPVLYGLTGEGGKKKKVVNQQIWKISVLVISKLKKKIIRLAINELKKNKQLPSSGNNMPNLMQLILYATKSPFIGPLLKGFHI